MTLAMEKNTGQYQYGETAYWVLRKNVGGSSARRLLEMVGLHFLEDRTPLVLDLRQVPVVDSEGAFYLEKARRRFAGLQVVGRPRDYATLPPAVRKALDVIRPSESLERALSSSGCAGLRQPWPQRRRHSRIPVRIPVEIFSGGRSAVARLHDISLGGGKLGKISSHVLRELRGASVYPELTIAGIDRDPLGQEIVGSLGSSEVVTRPVYILPGNGGMGVQFA